MWKYCRWWWAFGSCERYSEIEYSSGISSKKKKDSFVVAELVIFTNDANFRDNNRTTRHLLILSRGNRFDISMAWGWSEFSNHHQRESQSDKATNYWMKSEHQMVVELKFSARVVNWISIGGVLNLLEQWKSISYWATGRQVSYWWWLI